MSNEILQLQSELKKNPEKLGSLIKQYSNHSKKYSKLKKSYQKYFTPGKKLNVATLELILLTAIELEDTKLFDCVLHNHPSILEKKTFGVLTALCRYNYHKGYYIIMLQYYNELAENHEPLLLDSLNAQSAAFDCAQFKTCEEIIKKQLEKGADKVLWQIVALTYQVNSQHVTNISKTTIDQNINYLMDKLITKEHLLLFATCLYRTEKWQMSFKYFNLAISEALKTSQVSGIDIQRSTFDPEGCLNSAIKAQHVLSKMGITNFLAFGTFLGLHRDGQLMPYDKDADICVLLDVSEEQFYKTLADISKNGDFNIPAIVSSNRASHKWNVSLVDAVNGATIDLFFGHKVDNNVAFGIHTPVETLQWLYSKRDIETTNLTLNGNDVIVPKHADEYLMATYGSSWKEPIEVWDSLINAPNLDPNRYKSQAFYAFNRLFVAISKGQRLKIQNYVNFLQNHPTTLSPENLAKIKRVWSL